MHERDASLQRKAANQPGHSGFMYKSHVCSTTLCSSLNHHSRRPTIDFRHLCSSRFNLVNDQQRLVQSYLHLPEGKQLTTGGSKCDGLRLLRAPFDQPSPPRPQNSVGQLAYLSIHFSLSISISTNIGRPVDTVLLLTAGTCPSRALEQVHAPVCSTSSLVCISACCSHSKVDVQSDHPSDNDMVMVLESTVYIVWS